MSDNLNCPGCAAPVRVPEGMAGKRARCPQCQMIFTVPTASAAPAKAAASSPQVDLFKDANRGEPARRESKKSVDYDRDRRHDDDWDDDDLPRPRVARKRSTSGSALPWVLGIGGLALLLIMFCGGGVAIIAIIGWRGAEKQPAAQAPKEKDKVAPMPVPPPGKAPFGAPPPPAMGGQPVQGRFGPITRLQLVNGMVQVNSQITFQDPVDPDPDAQGHRAKFYQIDLQAGRRYQIDMKSPNFQALDPYLRIEDASGRQLDANDDINPGVDLNAQIIFSPPATATYVVFATTFDNNQVGPFTLTIRELKN